MRAIDVLDFFRSKAYWVNMKDTVDKIIVGNPEAEVCSILVTWMRDFQAINAAIERGHAGFCQGPFQGTLYGT